jgi:hypothetical protein
MIRVESSEDVRLGAASSRKTIPLCVRLKPESLFVFRMDHKMMHPVLLAFSRSPASAIAIFILSNTLAIT